MVTVVVMITATGLAGSYLSRRFALESASSLLKFNSVSLRGAIDGLMMSRNNSGVRSLLQDVIRGSDVYRDISLVSHPQGEVVASGVVPLGKRLGLNDGSCKLCHMGEAPPRVGHAALDSVTTGPDGRRLLRVVTPILNGANCQTADCHVHDASPPVLGFLSMEYSLARVDKLAASLGLLMVIAALAAAALTTGALFLVFRRLLDRPLRGLVAGLGSLAADDLSFRFGTRRNDEIGMVEKSFDRMAARIEAQQRDLRQTMEYLEGIVESSADLIITVNPAGLIETFNRGAEEALGYGREEVIGKRVETLFADPRERDVAIKRLQDTDNVTNYETRFLTKGGETREVLLTLSRLRDREGNPIGTFGISKDVTEEKELQRKLLESERIAAIGRAATGIQHAAKNMLNTLHGGLYVARVGRKRGNDAMVEEGHAMIEEGLERIGELSRHMLMYAREWKIEPQPTDLAQLAARVAVAVKRTAEDRGVTYRAEVASDLPLLSCDPSLLHMVLMDLVSNALDACEMREYGDGTKGEVVLRIFAPPDDDAVVIEVRDNGNGMTKEVEKNIFTPFFSTKKKGGTGLGLALTARIIELHGGRISVESAPDQGATFRIALPLHNPATDQGEQDGQEGHCD